MNQFTKTAALIFTFFSLSSGFAADSQKYRCSGDFNYNTNDPQDGRIQSTFKDIEIDFTPLMEGQTQIVVENKNPSCIDCVGEMSLGISKDSNNPDSFYLQTILHQPRFAIQKRAILSVFFEKNQKRILVNTAFGANEVVRNKIECSKID
jgi:hypothetical protein